MGRVHPHPNLPPSRGKGKERRVILVANRAVGVGERAGVEGEVGVADSMVWEGECCSFGFLMIHSLLLRFPPEFKGKRRIGLFGSFPV